MQMAGPTRLELATSGVTGRHSNQLNYDPAFTSIQNLNKWSFLQFYYTRPDK